MAEQSKIQWTEATWNPWHGCKKVSEGCKYCYMYRDKERYKQDPVTVLRSKGNFNAPLKWKEPKLIFTCSWSDWFIDEADAWRPEAWEIIKATPWHTYQILTKRPERIKRCLPEDWGRFGYKNVWLGVSVENQKATSRLKILKEIPAAVRFASIEPILELIDFNYTNKEINWVIVGGESGNDTGKYRYRKCTKGMISWIALQCHEQGIPLFIKQLGTYLSKQLNLKDRHGGDITEWPEHLQIRQMPIL